jgi:multiple sugar transport system substrate-binding protein
MDHPHTALAASTGALLPLDEYLPRTFLDDCLANSVGQSHQSYYYKGHQWTLASDAAAPIATWRPDLVEKYEIALPETWDDVIRLATEGFVSLPLFPIDSLMLFFAFCDSYGTPLFSSETEIGHHEVMVKALEQLKRIASLCAPECLSMNPIRVAEYMTSSDEKSATYCPFAYGYSNYSRIRFPGKLLKAGGLVELEGKTIKSVLGGAGIAVSSKTPFKEICTDFARFMASPEIQCGLYFDSGGQPGHRAAWQDNRINQACSDFFKDTLGTLDAAIVRPQYSGYMHFQDHASNIVHDCISGSIGLKAAIELMNNVFRESITHDYPQPN